MVTVDILICTIDAGILNVEKVLLEYQPFVRYVISWQRSSSENYTIPNSLNRQDVSIYQIRGSGLSKNRNNALKHATSDICLIADDDVTYSKQGIIELCNYFSNNKNVDVVTFYATGTGKIKVPTSFDLKNRPKGYNVSSIEISFRRNKIQGSVWFNELLGLGAPYAGSGEDDMFIIDCLQRGLTCYYVPLSVVFHPEVSTGVAHGGDERVIFARGVLTRVHHPILFPFMYVLLARSIKINHNIRFFNVLVTLFRGGIYAKRNGMI